MVVDVIVEGDDVTVTVLSGAPVGRHDRLVLNGHPGLAERPGLGQINQSEIDVPCHYRRRDVCVGLEDDRAANQVVGKMG